MDKIIFFIRAYNDLDHITPVIYALRDDSCQKHIIITTRNIDHINDYRIKLLQQQKGVILERVYQYHGSFVGLLIKLLKSPALLFKYLRQRTRIFFHNLGIWSYGGHAPDIASVYCVEHMLNSILNNTSHAVICLDHAWDDFVKKVVKETHNSGLRVVALPHGDANHANLNYSNMALDGFLKQRQEFIDTFDVFVMPSKYYFYKKAFDKISDPENKIAILGSPRYNKEWVDINNNLIPIIEKKEGKTHVLILMKFLGLPFFFEEFVTCIKLLAKAPNMVIALKHHTRLSHISGIKIKYLWRLKWIFRKYDNIEFFFDNTPTPSLINWSDTVIDLGTSAAFEAVLLRKNVAAIEYLFPERTTTAVLLPKAEIVQIDEWYDLIDNMVADPAFKTYTDQERDNFIEELIHYGGSNVLERFRQCILDNLCPCK